MVLLVSLLMLVSTWVDVMEDNMSSTRVSHSLAPASFLYTPLPFPHNAQDALVVLLDAKSTLREIQVGSPRLWDWVATSVV